MGLTEAFMPVDGGEGQSVRGARAEEGDSPIGLTEAFATSLRATTGKSQKVPRQRMRTILPPTPSATTALSRSAPAVVTLAMPPRP